MMYLFLSFFIISADLPSVNCKWDGTPVIHGCLAGLCSVTMWAVQTI